MVFDPHWKNADSRTLSSGANEELKQAHALQKKHSGEQGPERQMESEELRLEAREFLRDVGLKMLGHSKQMQEQARLFSALAAAIDVGAFSRYTIEPKGSPRDVVSALPAFAETLHSLLKASHTLTTHARQYAELRLEIPEGAEGSGPSSTGDLALQYLRQNQSRTLDQVETHTRWIVEHFDSLMLTLGSHLDGLISSIEELGADEDGLFLQLQRANQISDWGEIQQLISDDQRARAIILREALSLRERIAEEGPNSLIAPIHELRAALLAETLP